MPDRRVAFIGIARFAGGIAEKVIRVEVIVSQELEQIAMKLVGAGLRSGVHMERIVFNDKTEELRREILLAELHQRIREVRQGPDGLLYLLTDEDQGALLRIEPAQ